jgi:cephalosporin hydroxylase
MRAGITYSLAHPQATILGLRAEFVPEWAVTNAFHWQYHNSWWSRTMASTTWLGAPAQQIPLDLWIMQEIIHETRPDVLIETGTRYGGSALFYATVFESEHFGRVFSIDIADYPDKPVHARITYLVGSSSDPTVVSKIKAGIGPNERVMVVLDSAHVKEHVLKELDLYKDLVCIGCYLVVQDTHLTGHPVVVEDSPGPGLQGPMEAVDQFLASDSRFIPDRSRERYGLTVSPKGWLKRLK